MALQGVAESQYNLGLAYYKGEGVRQSYERSVYWHAKAAEQVTRCPNPKSLP